MKTSTVTGLDPTFGRTAAPRAGEDGSGRAARFGSGSLIEALREQVTRLDELRSSGGAGAGGGDGASGPGSDIVLAQAGTGLESPFDNYDPVESVKNPDIEIFDPQNPGNIEDPFNIDPTEGLEAAIFDGLAGRDRPAGLDAAPVRTGTVGTLTISEGDGFTSTTDSSTGQTVTYAENEDGERTTTVSTPQLDGANSPRSNVTYTEHTDGTVTRTESVTSPTGGTYELPPEPEPTPEPEPEPARRSSGGGEGSGNGGDGISGGSGTGGGNGAGSTQSNGSPTTGSNGQVVGGV